MVAGSAAAMIMSRWTVALFLISSVQVNGLMPVAGVDLH